MRYFLLIAVLTCKLAHGQNDDEDRVKHHMIRTEIGVKLGANFGSYTADGAGLSFIIPNEHFVSAGITSRTSLGAEKRWALEVGAYYNRTEKKTISHIIHWLPYFVFEVRTQSVELPVTIQYHLGPERQLFRPYFGIGSGLIWTDHKFIRKVHGDPTTPDTDWMGYEDRSGGSLILVLEQGFTCRISRRWSITEGVYYQYEGNWGKNFVGVRLGALYSLR